MRKIILWLVCFITILLMTFNFACSKSPTKAQDETQTSTLKGDGISPEIKSVSPTNEATGAQLKPTIKVEFSEQINSTTLKYDINGQVSTFGLFYTQGQAQTQVAGQLSYDDKINTAVFTPEANLSYSTIYYVYVKDEVKDMDGNSLTSAIYKKSGSWYYSAFTTQSTPPDTTAPTIESVTPINGATNVASNAAISVIFSEAMKSDTINHTNFSLSSPSGSIGGNVTYDAASKKAVFVPSQDLSSFTTYTATVSTAVRDAAGNQLANSYSWSFTTGLLMFRKLATNYYRDRYEHTAVEYINEIYLIYGKNSRNKKDIDKCSDTLNWTQLPQGESGQRFGHASVKSNNRILVIGGEEIQGITNGVKSDMWSSTDGSTWAPVSIVGPQRKYHTAVDLDNRIFLIGGLDGTNQKKNDVWRADFNMNVWTWQQIQTSGNIFSPRYGHASVSFNNKIWVIGGFDGTSAKNDVWSSQDGVTWTQVKEFAPFEKRYGHCVVAFNNKLYVIGGKTIGGVPIKDIWSSSDEGITWVQASADAPYLDRLGFSAIVFNNKLNIIGGTGQNGETYLDIWESR